MTRRPPRSTLFPYTTLFRPARSPFPTRRRTVPPPCIWRQARDRPGSSALRSEEHTSELQSHSDLVCRLLLEKKKQLTHPPPTSRSCDSRATYRAAPSPDRPR